MAAKKAPAKIAATKTTSTHWQRVACFVCSAMIDEAKTALRVLRINYAESRKTYAWAHRGCWK